MSCDFKPGDVLEFSNNKDFHNDCTVPGEFLCERNGMYWRLLPNNDSIAYGYRYARILLPNIKPGHPIMVYNKEFGIWEFRVFKNFDKSYNSVCTHTPLYHPVEYERWLKWKLIDNYDYTKDPEIAVIL